jgi:quinol monooxygenase YgiN
MVKTVHEQDDGCELYALHAVSGDPSRLVMLERWTSAAALEAHAGKPHVAALADVDALDGPPEVMLLEPLRVGDQIKGAL